jgi:hypothetical protein
MAIIRHGGDMAASQQDLATDLVALEETLDFLTIQSESALNPAKIGVSRSTQRMAVSSCHEWFGLAHGAFSRDYRLGLPTDVQAVFQGAHNGPGVIFNLPLWTGSFTSPMEELERSLAGHWDLHSRQQIDNLAFDWRKQALVPGIAVAGVFLFFAMCAGATQVLGVALFGFILALIGGGIWFLVLWSKSQAALKRQQALRALVAQGKQDSILQLRAAGAELVDWSNAFRVADVKEQAVRTLIADLATMGNSTSPYERRVTTGA